MNEEDLDAIEKFQAELEDYLREYEIHLLKTVSNKTVNKYSYIIGFGIEYICGYYDVIGLEDITFGMVSSKLYYNFQSHCYEPRISRKTVLNMMKGFFEFIYQKHGLRNPTLMKKLESAKL